MPQKRILEDDEGFVAKNDHGTGASDKPKERLPSPTDLTHSAIEMGMWALLKLRKQNEKRTGQEQEHKQMQSDDDDEELLSPLTSANLDAHLDTGPSQVLLIAVPLKESTVDIV